MQSAEILTTILGEELAYYHLEAAQADSEQERPFKEISL
jgi:hypothetical protein